MNESEYYVYIIAYLAFKNILEYISLFSLSLSLSLEFKYDRIVLLFGCMYYLSGEAIFLCIMINLTFLY